MRIYHEIPRDDAYRASREMHGLVLAIGFFDGFHRGHHAIVRALMRERVPGTRAGVLTFRNHPATHLRPDAAPPLIATLEERINALARAGIDELFLLRFDASIATLTPAEFLDGMLIDALDVRAVVVGENFRFGARRAGDVAFARNHLASHGRRFVAVPNVGDEAERVSSTRVRAAIAAGDLEATDAMLEAPYTIQGRIELGAGRGHALGFPTANLAVPPEKLLPPDGVYAALGRLDGRDYAALVSIGTNPTFDGRRRTVEVWLRDYYGSAYGEELSVRALRFLRAQVRFDSVDALREQMREDAAAVAFPTLRS